MYLIMLVKSVRKALVSNTVEEIPSDKTTFYLLSIGKLHFISEKWTSAVDSNDLFDLSNGKVYYRFDKCGRRSDNCISLVTTATRCKIVESIDSLDWWEWLFHSRFHIKGLSNRRIHLNDD